MTDHPQQEKKIWDQQEGEPNAAYARFLVYRNMGPARSLESAYRLSNPKTKESKSKDSKAKSRSKKQGVSGQWTGDSTNYNWVDRALAWDIEMMSTVGLQVVLKFYNSLSIIVDKALTKLADSKVRPKDWRQAVDAINRLGMLIPAETVRQIQDTARDGNLALGGSKSKDAGDTL